MPKSQIQSTLNIFNSYNKHLQFTIEEETNNQIPFLDLLITRDENQKLTTEWYSKPYSSNRLLNYHSYHPTKLKINVAHNFMHRVANLTTNKPIMYLKKQISKHLEHNCYPKALINRMLCRIKFNETTKLHTSYPITIPENTIINPADNENTSIINQNNLPINPTESTNMKEQPLYAAQTSCLAASQNTPATSINQHYCFPPTTNPSV